MIKVDENDPIGELAPTFPYRDVNIKRGVDMKEYYDLEGEIGRGKFGTVYKCREKATGLSLAAKFVGIARRQDRKNVEREVEIMKTLQHPRLIQLYDAFETDNVMCVVLELIEGGELFERVIDDDFILTEKSCTVFMRQICEGVAFIHSHNIIHLDLKPENILCLTKTGNRIKIIDFGLARKFEPDKKLQVLFGTPEFVAPEVVNFDQISCATDMWSVGVICYVLLSGLSPFMGETDVETMANVTLARYDFNDDSFDEISPEAKDFISKLLVKDKEARLTAVDCLSHSWLRRQLPPPPPSLDTTKENLKNFVDKYVSFSPTQIIEEKSILHNNKPRFIENFIQNEHKIYNANKNDATILPNEKRNILSGVQKIFPSNKYPPIVEKVDIPAEISEIKNATPFDQNIKNNCIQANNTKIQSENIHINTDLPIVKAENKPDKQNTCLSPGNTVEQNVCSSLKSVLMHLHENLKPPTSQNVTRNLKDTSTVKPSPPKPVAQSAEQTQKDNLTDKETVIQTSSTPNSEVVEKLIEDKIPPRTTPIIVFPSMSTSENSSDFSSFQNIQKQESSTRTAEFTRYQAIKNNMDETMSKMFSEHLFQESAGQKGKESNLFKQHLRSTPPWFSELSNLNKQNNLEDRFERRSSDFSCFLNSKEDSESLNLADEIRKLSTRLLQMSNDQNKQPSGAYSSNQIPSRSRNDPITCFLENHGIPHPRPKFKFSNLNRDVPIGSPPPPSNVAYYLNVAKNSEKKDSHSAPESPRASPDKTSPSVSSKTKLSQETKQNESLQIVDNSVTTSLENTSSSTIVKKTILQMKSLDSF